MMQEHIVTIGRDTYERIQSADVPAAVRFDVPGRNQGQHIEVAFGGYERGAHDEGDAYMRVHDKSTGPEAITYYRRRGLVGGACLSPLLTTWRRPSRSYAAAAAMPAEGQREMAETRGED